MSRGPMVSLFVLLLLSACSGGNSGPTTIELPIDRLEITSTTRGCLGGMTPDKVCQLEARALTSEGQLIQDPIVVWSSSNNTVVFVDSDEHVARARSTGTAVVRVSTRTDSPTAQVNATVFQPFPK